MEICGKILRDWCERLLKLQVREVREPSLYGGILCPACAGIHGRCFDAIYPFLYLADADHDERYLTAARLLFLWAENTVSREDGSYVNDMNSEWKGVTVFSVIGLVEALTYHGHILDKDTYGQWKARIAKAAEFLWGFRELEVCNINYRIAGGLAMVLCGKFLGEKRFLEKGRDLARSALCQISENGILFGEGRPVAGRSPKGCRPVDIGYNMEESLPAFLQYAVESGDKESEQAVLGALRRHLLFMTEDGGIDNSFGTRNYKWTYWGSRTCDGCVLGYLMAATADPGWNPYRAAAYKQIHLLSACTQDGYLYAGLHLREKGEPPCVHHAFCQAKTLAGILDRGLENELCDGSLPRKALTQAVHIPETDTYLIPGRSYTATVTGYDWEYMGLKGGHASGGTLSFLWHEKAGALICAGMSEYSLKEANNMQLPKFSRHECLTPRLEYEEDGRLYSSMYDRESVVTCQTAESDTRICVRGNLRDRDGNRPCRELSEYSINYHFAQDAIHVLLAAGKDAVFYLPLISKSTEAIRTDESGIHIYKPEACVSVVIQTGIFHLPYGKKRIYNMVPGLEAAAIRIDQENGSIDFSIIV